jgi:hypothetical protein
VTALLWIRPIFVAMLLALAVACAWSAYRDRDGEANGAPR